MTATGTRQHPLQHNVKASKCLLKCAFERAPSESLIRKVVQLGNIRTLTAQHNEVRKQLKRLICLYQIEKTWPVLTHTTLHKVTKKSNKAKFIFI